MFTVLIADAFTIDKMKQFRLFLEPFTRAGGYAVCEWLPGLSSSLAESVPDLERTVAEYAEWRAVIVCPDTGIRQDNPFDMVRLREKSLPKRKADRTKTDTEETEEEYQKATEAWMKTLSAYYDERLKDRRAACEKAAKQPLTRLLTRLCEDPFISIPAEAKPLPEKEGKDPTLRLREEREKAEYREIALLKQQLRDGIRGEEKVRMHLPAEVICVARRERDRHDKLRELKTTWTQHDEYDYSRFAEWNLYYDRCRFLICDVLSPEKPDYDSDTIRYLCALLILCSHDVPQGSLSPRRVYRLSCETDEEKLGEYLLRYEHKILATEDVIAEKVREIEDRPVVRLSDREARELFCATVEVPVTLESRLDTEGLYYREPTPFVGDERQRDRVGFNAFAQQAVRTLQALLRQPVRAVDRGARDLRQFDKLTEERAAGLTKFQADDIRDHVAREERAMVETLSSDLHGETYYLKKQEEAAGAAGTAITRRLRLGGLLYGLIAIVAAVLLIALPVFFAKMPKTSAAPAQTGTVSVLPVQPAGQGGAQTPGQIPVSTAQTPTVGPYVLGGAITAVLAALGIAAAFLTALWLFVKVRRAVREYNRTMQTVEKDVQGSLDSYAVFFSHLCSVMRGQSALDYHREMTEKGDRRVAVLRSHEITMKEHVAMLHDVYGAHMPKETDGAWEEQPYRYDFTKPVDYTYPIPLREEDEVTIDFIQKGCRIRLPVGFVRRITVTREELYDAGLAEA